MNKLADRISYLSSLSKMKDKDIANKIGVSAAYFSQLKTGIKETKNSELLHKLAEVLECNVVWLISGNETPYPNGKVQESVASYDREPSKSERAETEEEASIRRDKEAAVMQKEMDDMSNMLRKIVPTVDSDLLYKVAKDSGSLPLMEIVMEELRSRLSRESEK